MYKTFSSPIYPGCQFKHQNPCNIGHFDAHLHGVSCIFPDPHDNKHSSFYSVQVRKQKFREVRSGNLSTLPQLVCGGSGIRAATGAAASTLKCLATVSLVSATSRQRKETRMGNTRVVRSWDPGFVTGHREEEQCKPGLMDITNWLDPVAAGMFTRDAWQVR